MKLNARQVDKTKPRDKPFKLADGGGLYLLVNVNGAKYWRLKYRIACKEKLLALGVYPDTSLADARVKRDDARKILAAGGDPSLARQAIKQSQKAAVENTFKEIALEWHGSKSKTWSPAYSAENLTLLKNNIFPDLGGKPIAEIKPLELLSVLQKIEDRGATEQAKKARMRCSEVFRYAIVTGRATYNPAPDLISAMQGHKTKHYPSLDASELSGFFKSLTAWSGSEMVILAARLLIITGVRTGELRMAQWCEFDLKNAHWEIPAQRMKMRRPHIVPLSSQAVAIVKRLKQLTGHFPLVFPGRNDPQKCMSEASINQVFKRIGYAGRVTGHGFRHTMSTILHERGFNSAWIETQLAHADKNSIRGIYNHAGYLDGRREMLQWYADYLDELEQGKSHS